MIPEEDAEKVIYTDEGEIHLCKECQGEMEWEDCGDCEEGYRKCYEDDPINNNPDDVCECETCSGEGGWLYCPYCRDKAMHKEG